MLITVRVWRPRIPDPVAQIGHRPEDLAMTTTTRPRPRPAHVPVARSVWTRSAPPTPLSWSQATAWAGTGRCSAACSPAAALAESDRHRHALRTRVAERPGQPAASFSTTPPPRLHLPPEQAVALTDESSPAYLPVCSRSPSARWRTRTDRRTAAREPAGASAGTSTTPTCTTAASASSGPGTTPTWSMSGCRQSVPPMSQLPAPGSPTSVAATRGVDRADGDRLPRSTFVGSTTTRRPSTSPDSGQSRRGGRPGALEVASAQTFLRHRPRPRHDLRRPP